MKHSIASCRATFLMVLTALVLWPVWHSTAQDLTDDMTVARSAYAVDREAVIAQHLQLTDEEAENFWPLYRKYLAGRETLGDGLVKLVLAYSDIYPEVPEDSARQMLKDYTALEKRMADQRASYVKKFAKILPASKALRFVQLENRMDLVLRQRLASAIPLAPIEGRLTGQSAGAAMMTRGVPGGAVVQTRELTATVTAIDPAARKLTLLSLDGIKQTVTVGPEAINFDQIHLGDELKVTVTEELVVFVAGEGEAPSDATTQLVALAPKGAKPGSIMAQAAQVTATVTALDLEHRQATLRFEDGSTQTVLVRPDVNLTQRKVGDKVVIRITEALALSVQIP